MAERSHPDTVTFRIPSRLELLALLDRVTDAVSQRLAFDEDSRVQISMSVMEAGTNAIVHGHGKDPKQVVDVEFHMLPDRLEVTVHDFGAGFDLGRVNGDITSPDHLLDAHGRGIYIMRSCMDEVDFRFSPGGTLCRLVKRRMVESAS